MKENELYRALDAAVTGCQPSDYWKNRMVRQIVKGEEMKKRTKLSVGAILVAALLLISTVALAVGLLIHEYYAKVAQMEKEGALDRWQLEDKINFISTMKEYDFAMDESLYAQATDESLPAEQREAAADRIVNNTYGDLLQMNLDYYQTTEEDTLGMAPDVHTVFDERYFAEHPDWEETYEGVQAYFDALGHYLRDEIGMLEEDDTVPEKANVDEAYAVSLLKGEMAEYLEWDPEAVEAMIPQVEWDESTRIWTVSGEVSEASMEKATDLRKDRKPVLNGKNIEKTETGYRYSILVDEQGNSWNEDLDREKFHRRNQDETAPEQKISRKQALNAAEAAVKEKYHPDEESWKNVFSDISEEDGALVVTFHNHYYRYFAEDHLFDAVVNMTTGEVECIVDYQAADRTPEWQLLNYVAQTEEYSGWYTGWKPEQKQDLIQQIRACGLLPEHAYWQLAEPSGAETDAFVAEVFGAEGRLSLVNVKVMLHTLMGAENTWTRETKLLADRLVTRYSIRSEDLRETQKAGGTDIDAAEAERIVKAAVCEAWEMPGDALDHWAVVTRQVQDRIVEDITRPDPTRVTMVYYRVFLTRPDEEVGQDTFGGLDNFNYRITMDGTILTTETKSGWYSPKEDRERWRK